MKIIAGLLVSAGLIAGSATASAGNYDGSKTILCATQAVSQCDAGTECVGVTPESVDMPNFMVIDVNNKVISAPAETGTEVTTTIKRSEVIDGKLMLQGADQGLEDVPDGIGWTVSINENTGKMVAALAGDNFAIVAFGSCTLR